MKIPESSLAVCQINVPEIWQCAKMFRVFFFVGLMGTSLSGISQRVLLTKLAAVRPVAAINQDVTVCSLSD